MQPERTAQERSIQYQNLLHLIVEDQPNSVKPERPLMATRIRSIINCHRLAEAYKEQSKVAYVSDQYPTEIVFAFSVIPWNVESMAIMLAQSMDVNRIFQLTLEREVPRDICSFLRGPYGMMLANCYPSPDVVLTNDQPCDGLSKLMFISSKRFDVPVIGLHTPNKIDDDSVNYLVKQLEQVMSRMADELGLAVSPDSLRAAVEHSNCAREYYHKTLQLLQTHPLPGVSRELQEIFGMNYFGSRENVQLCKVLYEEAVELAKQETGKRRKRILWIGQVPEDSHEILQHMRQVVEIVFWAPLWEANTVMLDQERPLRSIAERAMLYHWNAERMGSELSQMCDNYQIEGFLIVNVWGCRNMLGITPMFRDLAAGKKLKSLTVNVDLVDRNNYAFNHVKNRLDAFLELMQ